MATPSWWRHSVSSVSSWVRSHPIAFGAGLCGGLSSAFGGLHGVVPAVLAAFVASILVYESLEPALAEAFWAGVVALSVALVVKLLGFLVTGALLLAVAFLVLLAAAVAWRAFYRARGRPPRPYWW